jgi:DNA-binding CsgD family transcriptional regulator
LAGSKEPVAQVIGREAEMALLGDVLRWGRFPWARVLIGEPGIGKTTLWESGVDLARAWGVRVLLARPAGSEAQLLFAGLSDLLDDVDLGRVDGLPAPQRSALEVALLRAEPTETTVEPRAIAAGLLSTLRSLAGPGPLLVAVDDIQWLDGGSRAALAFAARRIQEESVGFLLARRPGPAAAFEQAVQRIEFERIEVGPLSLGATRRLLHERFGIPLPRRLLRRLFDLSQGNPLLALELGRTLVERGPPEIAEEMPVPEAVEDLLRIRIAQLPRGVRRLLVAVALSPGLRVPQLLALGDREAFEQALEDGVLLIDGDRVRPSHPLLAAAAQTRMRAAERRTLHLELAEVVGRDGLRARHLALATVHPDASLATTVSAAAKDVFARGARQEAVEMAEHARRLTPPDAFERTERLLVLASYLETAGELQRVTDLLTSELASIPAGSLRARAWLLLAEGAHIRHVDDYKQHLERALAEAQDDPALRARVVAKMSSAVISVERIAEAEALALEVLPAARRAGPDVERPVLFAVAWARGLQGRAVDQVCERFAAASRSPGHLAESPERIAGQRFVWRGEIGPARILFDRLLALADERGELIAYVWARLHLCELALRTGDWEVAARLLEEWAEASEEFIVMPLYQRCRALLAAGQGFPEEAERWAREAITRAEAMGTQWDWLEALRAGGLAALLVPDHARAAGSLRAVWEHTRREGVDDPGVFPVAPDLVEVLVELGERDEALAVTSRLRTLAEEQEHPWGLATAKRCEGLVRFSADSYDEAAAALTEAAAAYGSLGLRFDQARTLLALGRDERRLRKWGAASRSLEQAAAIFDEIGSTGWAEQARSELERVGGRRPKPLGQLTRTEERVAGLAAEGLSNKEIAAALFVTVHTVEVHLSHVYRKLGIRSRSQLAARLPS